MANVNDSLKEALSLDGAKAVALVDYTTGMTLGTSGDTVAIDLDIAAAGSTEVVRAQMRAMSTLGLEERIEDILITLEHQFHLARLVKGHEGLFLYVVLDKDKSNLGMARFKLAAIEKSLEI